MLAHYAWAWAWAWYTVKRVIGAYRGRKLFTMRLHIVVYMRKRGGALFCGVYIGRFYRGEWRFFLRMCLKVLDKFCILVYYRDSLNKSSVNIQKHIR